MNGCALWFHACLKISHSLHNATELWTFDSFEEFPRGKNILTDPTSFDRSDVVAGHAESVQARSDAEAERRVGTGV